MTEPRDAVMTLLVATSNRGKLAELRSLLAHLPVEVVGLAAALPDKPQVNEDGVTFEENAVKKARYAAQAAMLVTLADDSGLEVDALAGRPGVRSARFAGEGATDAQNNAALLSALGEFDDDNRAARFRCVLALVDPWNEAEPVRTTEGRCEGSIARVARGAGGFGYDPLFLVGDTGLTMAELAEDEKNRLSHRAKAVEAMLPLVERLVEERIASAGRVGGA